MSKSINAKREKLKKVSGLNINIINNFLNEKKTYANHHQSPEPALTFGLY